MLLHHIINIIIINVYLVDTFVLLQLVQCDIFRVLLYIII